MSDEDQIREGDDRSGKPRWAFDEGPWKEYTRAFDWAIMGSPDQLDLVLSAQASFPEFARAAELERFRILPTYEAVSIKAFFEAPVMPRCVGEHIFLTNVFTDGKTVTATLNADSFRRDDLKEGQEVTSPIEKVSDWFLVRSGKGLGGFTIPQVWSTLSEAEQEQFRDE